MSTTIDERVVEMRFDNKHFESNVATSMSTLDKLKQKLNLSGASKGLEDINAASKKVDMSGLGRSIEAVTAKFSAMQVIGVTALANITNQAVNAGKRIASALTIDPVKTGFHEYETQINAVQTILANTSSKGTTINDVTAALDELNKYADLTIYNFTEMTRNIGTFTAAGIDLETSVNAIQGIANLAAVSGSTSQQASTAMYQLSQALASGTVKLTDWNSVVNAGMGGEVFQNALKETSRLLGTGADEAIKTTGSFRESLREEWLTAEVLTETLKKFTSSGAVEYIAEYTGESQEAVNAILNETDAWGDDADAIDKAAEALSKKSGKNKDEIKSALEMAKNAQDAATKVKTFSQLWDVMKEAAQSGWAKTWQIIIGDFEEAKSLFTPLSDFFTNIINKMSDWRNDLLSSALGKSFNKIGSNITKMLKPASKAAETITNVTDSLGDLDKIVSKVIKGDFGNGEERFNAITEAGINYYKVQNKVNETLGDGFRYSDTIIKKQDDIIGKQKETNDAVSENIKLTEEQKKQIKELIKYSDEELDKELRAMGYNEQQIKNLNASFDELRSTAEKLGIPLNDFIDNLDEINGRWLLVDSFKNVGKNIVNIFDAITDAWKKVFDPIDADSITDVIGAFHNFTTEITASEETLKNITSIFEGLFSAFDIVKLLFGGTSLVLFKTINSILKVFDLNIIDVAADVAELIVSFRKWLRGCNGINVMFDALISKLPVIVQKFDEWFNLFTQMPAVQVLVNAITAIGDAFNKLMTGKIDVNEFARSLGENLAKALKSLPEIAIQIGKDFIAGFQNGITDSVSNVITKIIEFCSNFIAGFRDALGEHSPSVIAYAIGAFFIAGFINGVMDNNGDIIAAITEIANGIINIFKSFWDFLTDENGNIDWGKIFAGGSLIAMLFTLKKVVDIIGVFANGIQSINGVISAAKNVLNNFGKVLNSVALDLKANAILKIAGAVGILVAALGAIVWMTEKTTIEKMRNAVGIIFVLSLIVVGLAIAMNKLASASIELDGKAKSLKASGMQKSLLQIGLTLLALSAAVKLIGDMDPESAKQGFIGLAGIAVGLVVFLAAIGGISRYSENVDAIGNMMIKLSIAMGIMAFVMKSVSKMDPNDIVIGLSVMEAFVLLIYQIGIANAIAGTGGTAENFGGNVIKISIAMGIMAFVLKLLATMDPGDVLTGVIVLEGFALLLVQMALINRLAGSEPSKFGGAVMGMSTAILILTGVIWLLSKMDPNDIQNGIEAMQKFVLVVAELLIISKIAGNDNKIAATILAMSTAIGMLAAVAILLSFISLEGLTKGITAIGILSLMMTMMIKQLKGAQNAKGAIMMMAISIGVMASAVAALSFIPTKDLAAATASMTVLMATFALMIKQLKGVKSVKIVPLIAMASLVAILTGIVVGLSFVNAENAVPNVLALSTLMAVLGALLIALSKLNVNFDDAISGIIALTAMVIPLVVFCDALNRIGDISGAQNSINALVSIMAAMTLLLIPLALIGKFAFFGALLGIVALTAMVAPLYVFCKALYKLPDVSGKQKNIDTLVGIMTSMTLLLIPLSLIGLLGTFAIAGVFALTAMVVPLIAFAVALDRIPDVSGTQKNIDTLVGIMTLMKDLLIPLILIGFLAVPAIYGVIALTTMVVPLVAFGLALHLLPDVSKAHANIITLTTIMASMILLLAPLGIIGFLAVPAIAGVIALTTMVVPLVAFGLALHLLPDVSGAYANIITLTTIMASMILLLAPLGIIGFLAVPAIAGVIALTTMVVPLVAFGLALHLLPDVTDSIGNVILLSNLMSFLTDLLIKIAPVAPLALMGVVALAALEGLIIAFGAIAVAVGFLMEKCSDIQSFLDIGIPVLEQLASGLGSVIGSFITGFAGEVMTILPQLGVCLSMFMTGVQPFISLASSIDASVVVGAGYLTAAILVLSGASFLTGIMSILTLGQSSLIGLGLQLYIFGTYAKTFFDTIKSVDASAVEAANNVANMILTLTATDAITSIMEKFGGSVDFSTLGESLKTFGEAVVSFSETISGKIDVSAVKAATNAGLLLVELNKSLPKTGGFFQDIAGEQDFNKFATACKAFGEAIISINETLSQEGFEIQSEKLEQLVKAGKKFNELNEALPRTGGIAQDLAGEQDLAGFGKAVVAFTRCMIAVNTTLSQEGFNVQSEKFEELATAGKKFNELNTALPKTGGIAQDLAGEQDLAGFGKAVVAFTRCMIAVNTALNQEGFAVNLKSMEQLKQAGVKMNELQDVLPKTGGWWQDVSGQKDIGDFGKKIGTFADAIIDFSTSSTQLDKSGIDTCINTAYRIKHLIESLIGIDYSGVSAFTGVGTYDIASAISAFGEKVANINTEAVTVAVSSAKNLKSLIQSLVGLDTSGIDNFKPGIIGDQMKSFASKVENIDTGVVSSSITSANRLKTFIASLIGVDSTGISNFKIGSIGTSLKNYSESVSAFNQEAVSGSIASAKQLMSFIASLANLDTSGVGSFTNAITKLSTVNINEIVSAFSGATTKFNSSGTDMIDGLIKGMESKIPSLITVVNNMISTSIDKIHGKRTSFNKEGAQAVTEFKNGISKESSKAASEAKEMAGDAVDKIRSKYNSFYNAGSYLVDGFKNGISENSYKAAAKAKAMADSAIEAARKELRINSPSKVFKEIGSGIPEGFAIGIGMLGSTVDRSVTDMASRAIDSTRSAMTSVLEVLDSDIDAQPTIRPVIDLSDAKTGANAINDMFNGVRTVGVRSNLNVVNSMMNSKPQNGTNNDIISAINKLNSGLDNNRGDTYNFGDFTYDGGTEISEAVHTLVRAARMGRRV